MNKHVNTQVNYFEKYFSVRAKYGIAKSIHKCIIRFMNTTQAEIIKLRDAGLSQTEIARKVGTSQATICRWESGAIPPVLVIAGKVAKLAKSVGSKKRAA